MKIPYQAIMSTFSISFHLTLILIGMLSSTDATPLMQFGSHHLVRDSVDFQWGPCNVTVPSTGNFSCGLLDVPLDYQNPNVGNGRLAMIKLSAATLPRKGILFSNPGGPGDSGVSWVAQSGQMLQNYTGPEWDIVGWDPRGVGSATIPGDVFCFGNSDDYFDFWNDTLEINGIEYKDNFSDQADIDALLGRATSEQQKYVEFAQRCTKENGEALRYVGTAATARDMVAIADAIGEPGKPVNYWGFSYGTVIGSYFINMFPDRVGRVILDGVVNPIDWTTQPSNMRRGDEVSSADLEYDGFANACALTGPGNCVIANSSNEFGSDILNFTNKILDAGRDYTVLHDASSLVRSSTYRNGAYMYLYHPNLFPVMARDFHELASDLASLNISIEAGVQARDMAERPTSVFRNMKSVLLSNEAASDGVTGFPPYGSVAITCGDAIEETANLHGLFSSLINVTQTISPLFGGVWPLLEGHCASWTTRAVERFTGPFNAELANPILVIGNKADPITPAHNAKLVADMLGHSAVFLHQDGLGHTSIAQSSQCTFQYIHDYINSGSLPNPDTHCAIDSDVDIYPNAPASVIAKSIDANATTTV